ncbi:MAG: tRNA (adenosine(37)-N6)-threonylcarbamoyltransferase complex ATPase subunit type 1 TsaE [Halieaceae bacterium]|nr:tRNA (adenosine(37)-N6)-threonylcarbamoyltransferase complex ATPase subunit type 1 TsaE [Halieaceae bacterium]
MSALFSLACKADSEDAMVALGRRLGEALLAPALVELQGDLGMGKTTLCRGILRAFGHDGAVKSPTYTLVEPYDFADITVYHFDLYRLGDPEELEFLGIRDYFRDDSVALVEWPERGSGVLPPADLCIYISAVGQGRELRFEALSQRGVECLRRLPIEPVNHDASGVQ